MTGRFGARRRPPVLLWVTRLAHFHNPRNSPVESEGSVAHNDPPRRAVAPSGLAELTAVGVIISVNDTLPSWLGAPQEDVVGHQLFEFVNDGVGTLRNAMQSDTGT
jgi:hypothetical protein